MVSRSSSLSRPLKLISFWWGNKTSRSHWTQPNGQLIDDLPIMQILHQDALLETWPFCRGYPSTESSCAFTHYSNLCPLFVYLLAVSSSDHRLVNTIINKLTPQIALWCPCFTRKRVWGLLSTSSVFDERSIPFKGHSSVHLFHQLLCLSGRLTDMSGFHTTHFIWHNAKYLIGYAKNYTFAC